MYEFSTNRKSTCAEIMRKSSSLDIFRYHRNGSSLIKFVIYQKKNLSIGILQLFSLSWFVVFFYFLHVHWFYFLGSNNRQLTNDEENPERHKLLSHNDRDGMYIFERNLQDKNNSLKL